MENKNISLRLVEESDIPILYEMLKEMLETQNSSVNERPLPPLSESQKYVKKYLHDNDNHEIDFWYVIIDKKSNVIGSTKISNKNYVSYQVLKQFRGSGIGTKAVELLIKLHPRNRYFATINFKNEPSLRLIEKLGFQKKALVFEKIIE